MPRASLADPSADLYLRNMPPTEILPKPLAEAITAYNQARINYDKAKQDATHFQQVELAHAREEDVIALADAQEANKKAPTPKREAEALEQLAHLTRDVAAKEVVEDRARIRLDDALSSCHAKIVEHAGQRVEKARSEIAVMVDEIEAKLSELANAEALTIWASEPLRGFKVRALRTQTVALNGSPLTVDQMVAGLRETLEPPKPTSLPLADSLQMPVPGPSLPTAA